MSADIGEFCGKVISACQARSIAVKTELSNLDVAQEQAKNKITSCRWVYRSFDRISKARFWDIPTHAKQLAEPLLSNGQCELTQDLLSDIESRATSLERISAELRTHRIPEDRSLPPEPKKKAIGRPVAREVSSGHRVLLIATVIVLVVVILTVISQAWRVKGISGNTHQADAPQVVGRSNVSNAPASKVDQQTTVPATSEDDERYIKAALEREGYSEDGPGVDTPGTTDREMIHLRPVRCLNDATHCEKVFIFVGIKAVWSEDYRAGFGVIWAPSQGVLQVPMESTIARYAWNGKEIIRESIISESYYCGAGGAGCSKEEIDAFDKENQRAEEEFEKARSTVAPQE
jgi:hypothetical protein